MPQTENEKYFFDPNTKSKIKFPSILSASTVYLSVIVPSYNEEKRCNGQFYFKRLNDIILMF